MIKGIRNKLVYFIDDAFKVKYLIVRYDLKNEYVTLTKVGGTGKIMLSAKWNQVSYVEE